MGEGWSPSGSLGYFLLVLGMLSTIMAFLYTEITLAKSHVFVYWWYLCEHSINNTNR